MDVKETLALLAPRAQSFFEQSAYADQGALWTEFLQRLQQEWPELFSLLMELYGREQDFLPRVEQTILSLVQAFLQRGPQLQQLDRSARPLLDQETIPCLGGILSLDPLWENLDDIREKLPYLKDIGIDLLHLTPLPLDRELDPTEPNQGTVAELQEAALLLRQDDIRVAIDYGFAYQHGECPGTTQFGSFYHLHPNRRIPDAYDLPLQRLFPATRVGCYLWNASHNSWTWTGFDVEPEPEVPFPHLAFKAMLDELLFLANLGVEIFCLQPPLVSSPLSTPLLRALYHAGRIVVPGLLFYGAARGDETPLPPDPRSCRLSQDLALPSLIWEAAATRDTRLLRRGLEREPAIASCAWCTTLRGPCTLHWTLEFDQLPLHLDKAQHLRFLHQFYDGRFPGSFARGVAIQGDSPDEDQGICGTLASLAGLEQALEHRDPTLQDMAVRRICLLYSVLLSMGGLPFIYLGEEWGLLNESCASPRPEQNRDFSRIHRLRLDWQGMEGQFGPNSTQGRLQRRIVALIRLRRSLIALHGRERSLVPCHSPAILAYHRQHRHHRLLILCNFCEEPTPVPLASLHHQDAIYTDLVSGRQADSQGELVLDPYQFCWLAPKELDRPTHPGTLA